MNREEAIRAMLNGKKVKIKGAVDYCYYDSSKEFPFQFFSTRRDKSENMDGAWEFAEWEFYEEPKPKKRYMTREEVLGFVCNTPGIVVRYEGDTWQSSLHWTYMHIARYEYAYIDKQGNIGEPHKFMVEETS